MAQKRTEAGKQGHDSTQIYFGKKVRAIREAQAFSQADLGRLVGIPQPDMPAIERGERDVRLSTANRFAQALGVHISDLLPKKPRQKSAAILTKP